jgi:eukaryotic-like serine/threonine-protein kinase
LQTEFNEQWAKLSPNGQWLAYSSDETKRNEVYIKTFPTPGRKLQVSANGGDRPVWSRDGKELFYIGADRKMMVVDRKAAPSSIPVCRSHFLTRASEMSTLGSTSARTAASSSPRRRKQAASVSMTMVVNWTAGLRK